MPNSTDPQVLAGRYHLEKVVGEGGMAVVWRATDTLLHRTVAVKVLRAQYASDPAFLARFQSEARAAAALNDPGIVAVYDVGEDDGRQYLVLEMVPGEDMKAVIRREAPLAPERVVRHGAALARAVAAAHKIGLVHRDLKPQNVLLTPDGRLKVADFGIARAVADAGVTAPGIVMGTAHYVAPEQAAGGAATPASDVYSLGVVLYEMLTGHVPFDADTAMGVAMRIINEDPPSVVSLNPHVPERLAAIVSRAMARRPEDRYADAGALAHVLEAYLKWSQQDTDIGPIPVGTPAREPSAKPVPKPAPPPRDAFATPAPLPITSDPSPDRPPSPMMPPVARGNPSTGRVNAHDEPLFDWTGLILALVAAAALAGLIPLWYQVYLRGGASGGVGSSGATGTGAWPAAAGAGAAAGNSNGGTDGKSGEGGTLAGGAGAGQPSMGAGAGAGAGTLVTVPNLRGKTETEAVAVLKSLDLPSTSEPTDGEGPADLAPGQVADQQPRAGEAVPAGTVVSLIVVAKSLTMLEVPNVVGQTYDAASGAVQALGLVPEYRQVWSGRGTSGENGVVSVSPPPGSQAMAGDRVILSVNSGPYLSLGVTLGDGLYLAGASLDQNQVAPGETLAVVPSWEAVQAIEGDYTAVAMLENAAGSEVARAVASPLTEEGPSSALAPGAKARGRLLEMAVPADAAAGQYSLWLMVHRDGAEAEVLPVKSGGFAKVRGNRVLVMELRVGR